MVKQIPNNLYFVGLMGAGKTTVGKIMAKKLGKTFYDSDLVIEQKTGVKITTIFELEGETGFRRREAATIAELAKLDNIVLATGGGAVLAEENRQQLSENGYVIYLRANVHDLWQRMRHDRQRPLLQNVDIKEKLTELYHERNPLYTELASLIVDTGHQPVAKILNKIEAAFK